jgi:hypothetical protein
MYAPKQGKNSSETKATDGFKLKADRLTMLKMEHEMEINTDIASVVKMKVRAAYPEHKSKMRIHPANSPL